VNRDAPTDSLRQSVTRGTAVSLVSIVVMRAIGFLTSLVLAHRLGPSQLGAWVILVGFQSVVVVVAALGLPLIAPKAVAEAGPEMTGMASVVRGLLGVSLALGAAAGLAVALLAPVLAPRMLGPDGDVRAMAWLGFAVAAVVWSTAAGAILQGLGQIQRLAIANAGLAAVNLVLILPATGWLGLAGAVVALGTGHLLFTLAVVAGLPEAMRRPGWSDEAMGHVRRGLALGWPLLVSTLLVPLVAWLGRTWLGQTAGLESVGHYQVAETLNQAILFVPMAITMPLYPMIARLAAGRRTEAVQAFSPVFAYVTLLALPAALVVGWLAPLWVRLFGPGFEAAAPAVALLSAGFFLSSAGYLTGSFLAGFGMTGRSFLMNATWAALYLASVLLLVPRWGALGLAGAHVLSYALYTGVLAFALKRWIGLDIVPAPRLIAGGLALIGLGLWLMTRLDPVGLAFAAVPALLLSLALGGNLWRRAGERLGAWVRPR
jgi:PST family polysaccharide transporter